MGRGVDDTAFGILLIANELMIKAIREITVMEGIDPRESTLVAGGGAAGLNILPIARELGCERVVLPDTASALSACGMQYADITHEHSKTLLTSSEAFDIEGVGRALSHIRSKLDAFALPFATRSSHRHTYTFAVEARYRFQVWDLEIAVPDGCLRTRADVDRLVAEFHRVHERVFAVRDQSSIVEFLNWKGRVTLHLQHPKPVPDVHPSRAVSLRATRQAFFGGDKRVATPVIRDSDLQPGSTIRGPSIIEMPTTTIVIYPGMAMTYSRRGNFVFDHTPVDAAARMLGR
jgi:N-methylhydantoinase A